MLDVEVDYASAIQCHAVDADTADDRRRHKRHVTVLRVAKLFTAHGEEFCVVHNISNGGLMAQVYSDLQRGDRLTVEFKSGWVIPARVVWRREGRIGAQFDHEVDCAAVLSGTDFMPLPCRIRAPRVRIDAPARIRLGSRYRLVEIHNISQGGANLEPMLPEDVDQRVVLTIGTLPPIAGCVRWQSDGRGGVSFDNPVPIASLGRWVIATQSAGSIPNDPAEATRAGGAYCFPVRRAGLRQAARRSIRR